MRAIGVVLLGDLNLTDREIAYDELTARLADTYRVAGSGLGNTWRLPVGGGLPFRTLRIDMVLTGPGLEPLSNRPDCTPRVSDHCIVDAPTRSGEARTVAGHGPGPGGAMATSGHGPGHARPPSCGPCSASPRARAAAVLPPATRDGPRPRPFPPSVTSMVGPPRHRSRCVPRSPAPLREPLRDPSSCARRPSSRDSRSRST